MRVRRFLYLVLLLLAAALGWQVVATWTTVSLEVTPAPPLPSQPDRGEEALLRFPLDKSKGMATVIAGKNLFDPTRQQHDEEEGVVEVAIPPPDHLKLVGVLQLSGEEQAFFTDAQRGGKVVRVRVGEEIGQYRLTQAEHGSVTLAFSDGEEVSLSLAVQRGEAAAKAPRMRLPRKQAVPAKKRPLSPPLPVPAESSPSAQRFATEEERALRRQIRQLHKRLREVRQQRKSTSAEEKDGDAR